MTKNEQQRIEWLLSNPSTDMLKMGSLASGCNLSQECVSKIWKVMAAQMLFEQKQRQDDFAVNDQELIWIKAPTWANLVVCDSHGFWYYCECMPTVDLKMNSWIAPVGTNGKFKIATASGLSRIPPADWTQTATPRPEGF